MTLAAPSLAVCNLMDGQSVTPPVPGFLLQYGRNVFRGPVRAPTTDGGLTVPHAAVFALGRTGGKPLHYHETADRLFSDVSVFVRMEPNRFEDGEDLARSVWRLLQRNIPTDYLECHCVNSEPEFIGLDDAEHPIWTINLELIRVE